MCGIAGLIDLEGLSFEEREAIGPMTAALSHRGPDGRGEHHDDCAALGHARLSIIDLAAGRQPMSNEDGSVWITFNGEIYNFAELRRELSGKGHVFQSRSDTEVIVHLYEEEGDRCVERLRGMFAFAIWDAPRRRVLLARDRLGIKPLYYTVNDRRLIFGSELKALLAAPGCPRDIDTRALLDYLTFLFVPGPKSIFAGVHKLPPGHTAVFDERGLRLREYWDIDFSRSAAPADDECVPAFREKLTDAVEARLIADVPLGAFLSGGLDSSAVVATMAGLSSEPVVTSSIGFDERRFNELEFADRVAAQFGTRHHRQVVRADAVELLPKLAWHWDEPFADSSAVPTFRLCELARRQVTVALSGDGGDENLAGYRKHRLNARQRAIRAVLPAFVRRGVFGPLGRVYPKADWLPQSLRAKSTFQELALSDLDTLYLSRAAYHPGVVRSLLNADLQRELADYDPRSVIEEPYRKCRADDPLNRELYVDLRTYLVDDILTKVDRASMAVGLEVRVPMLDHHLVDFMAGLPSRWKLHRGEGKRLLKETFRPVLGSDIVDRRKQGFSVPLDQWLRGPLRGVVEETVFGADARVGEWLDIGQLRRFWTAHQRQTRSMGTMIWAVLMLEQWARTFTGGGMGGTSAPRSSLMRT